jgi:hypothetical protein
MPVTQPDDVANDGHDSKGATNVLDSGPPLLTYDNTEVREHVRL